MAANVGVAYVDILPRFTAFVGGLQKGMGKVSKRLDAAGKTITRSLALPLALAGGASVKLAVDFEESMAKITGLVGIAKDEVDEMAKSVLALAPAVGKGPRELAEALFFITSSGFKGASAMKVLEASARAAAAGLGETQDVADAVTSAVNAYGEENLSAAQATDILVAAVREGKGEADELAGVIGRVIPVASEMGVEFDEVAAAVSSMTLTGLDAAEAVTALRGFLSLLLKPAQQSRKRLEELGLTQADVAAITGRLNLSLAKGGLSVDKLRQIIAEKGLFEGMTALSTAIGDNRDALGEVIPNVRALTGFLSITGKNAASNAEIFRQVAGSVGDADKAFAAAGETARFKFNAALASLQSAGVQLGNELLPVVKDMAEALAGLVKRFSELSPGTKKWIAQLLVALAVLGPLLSLTSRIVKTFQSLIGLTAGIVQFFGAVIAGARGATVATGQLTLAQRIGIATGKAFRAVFLTSFGLIAVALIAVVAAVIIFRKQILGALKAVARFFVRVWKKVADFFVGVWEAMLDVARDFVRGLQRIWGTIGPPIVKALKVVGKVIATVVKVWVTIFKVQFAILKTIVKVALAPIAAIVRVAFAALVGVIRVALIPVAAVVLLAFQAVKLIIQGAVLAWRNVIVPAMNAIMAVFRAAWNTLVAIVRAVAGPIAAVIRFYARTWLAIFRTVWNAIAAVVRTAWGVIKATVVPAVKFVAGVIAKVVGAIRDNWRTVWEGLKTTVKTVWDGISGVVKTAVNIIIGMIERFLNTLTAVPRKLGGLLSKVPGLGGLKSLSNEIKLPRLDVGGTVEQTGAAIVHRGEVVIPPDMQDGIGAGGTVVNITVHGSVTTERELVRAVREALLATKRRNVNAGLA